MTSVLEFLNTNAGVLMAILGFISILTLLITIIFIRRIGK